MKEAVKFFGKYFAVPAVAGLIMIFVGANNESNPMRYWGVILLAFGIASYVVGRIKS